MLVIEGKALGRRKPLFEGFSVPPPGDLGDGGPLKLRDLVPVHSQHRGRLFLPFADEYPKTAEVISKVLLLARDQDIRDPNLLEQIRSRG